MSAAVEIKCVESSKEQQLLQRNHQHLLPFVWQVYSHDLWSFRKAQSLRTLARKRQANAHSLDTNFVWDSHGLSIDDQCRIEECYLNGGGSVNKILYKGLPYFADLGDASDLCLRSEIGPSHIFPRELRRIDRFMSGIRGFMNPESNNKDCLIRGWLDRPYEQEWPEKPPIRGPMFVPRSKIPSRFDDAFEYPSIPFCIPIQSRGSLMIGDQVSYHIRRMEDGLFQAIDLELEYSRSVWGSELNERLWQTKEGIPFPPERILTEVWQIRAMMEADRERNHALRVALKMSNDNSRMGVHSRHIWKSMHPRMIDCLRWLHNNPKQRTRFPWLSGIDAVNREQFVDFESMMMYTRLSTNGMRSNVSRIRRVTRFKSEVKKTSRVSGLRVAWLSRSVEQTMLYDHGYDLIPLMVDSDDCGAEVRSALECGVWLEYSIRYIRMDPPIYGRHFYAERPRVMAESAIRQARQAWAQRLRAMGEESLLRQIRCEKRKSFQKMRAELDQRCPLVPMDRPRNATQMIGDLEVLIDQCDWLMNAQGFGFERKKLGDWTREDVIDWITCVDHGRFSAHYRMIKTRMEVSRIIGLKIHWMIDPYFNQSCLRMKIEDAEILSEHVKDLIQSHRPRYNCDD